MLIYPIPTVFFLNYWRHFISFTCFSFSIPQKPKIFSYTSVNTFEYNVLQCFICSSFSWRGSFCHESTITGNTKGIFRIRKGVEGLEGEGSETASIHNFFEFYCKSALLEADVGSRHCFLKNGEITLCGGWERHSREEDTDDAGKKWENWGVISLGRRGD